MCGSRPFEIPWGGPVSVEHPRDHDAPPRSPAATTPPPGGADDAPQAGEGGNGDGNSNGAGWEPALPGQHGDGTGRHGGRPLQRHGDGDGDGSGPDTRHPAPPQKAGADGDDWQKTVAIDLDGTLAHYQGWSGQFTPIGPPIIDSRGFSAQHFTQVLRDAGFRIIIFTCRGDLEDVARWLNEHQVAYDGINSTCHNAPGSSSKPVADVYLDDRGVRFTGNFMDALKQIVSFKPHWDGDEG